MARRVARQPVRPAAQLTVMVAATPIATRMVVMTGKKRRTPTTTTSPTVQTTAAVIEAAILAPRQESKEGKADDSRIDWVACKVSALKGMCRTQGLRVGGKKAALIARLKAHQRG